jgi:RNA polymerase sigma-70 factor, ECF subfamily
VTFPATVEARGRGRTAADERLSALWHAHHPAVLAYARRRAPEETAQEVAGAAFAVLWRRIAEPPDDPRPWLLAVARRELANRRRGEARWRRLTGRVRQGTTTTAPDPADDAVEQAMARAALARLRPDDREVLMLVAWDGLDPAAAAAVLGITSDAFAVRLHRARRRLETHLTPREESPR